MYARFAAMVGISTVAMFGAMYLNTYQLDHVLISETRAYMALVMGSAMAAIMLALMGHMLEDRRVNAAIYVACAAIFASALWLVRSQATVDDASYMRAMIPHHSIAIMTSRRAQLRDPRVRKLSEEIIAAQEREIGEMKGYLEDLAKAR